MAATETFLAYLRQLSDNQSVQADLDRALQSARVAYARARRAKNLKEAAADRGVRVRVQQSLVAARSAAQSIRRGPEIEQRRRRRRPLLVAGAAIAGAVAVALYPDLRTQLSRQSSAEPA